MTGEKFAFKMKLRPGKIDEYKRRHDDIWPELAALLKDAGVADYSIHFDEETDILFAVLWRAADQRMENLGHHPVMRRWWAHMADLMETHPDHSPIIKLLVMVFHLE